MELSNEEGAPAASGSLLRQVHLLCDCQQSGASSGLRGLGGVEGTRRRGDNGEGAVGVGGRRGRVEGWAIANWGWGRC